LDLEQCAGFEIYDERFNYRHALDASLRALSCILRLARNCGWSRGCWPGASHCSYTHAHQHQRSGLRILAPPIRWLGYRPGIWARQLQKLGGIALLIGWAEGGFAVKAVMHALAPWTDIFHALLGQIFFASIVAIVVCTSENWRRGPEFIEDSWRPSLKSLTIAIPSILLLQITLGAAYRYRALGVIWHILNAMIVLLLILIVAIFLIRQFPQHRRLRPAAVSVAVITSIQVLLGFTTFMMLILFPETSLAVVITSVLHVTTAALTLGAGVSLAILIRHDIRAGRSLTGQ
jgi:heme A synthase